jgi:ATP synthase protein I
MFTAVGLQVAATTVLALIALIAQGVLAALSLILGGAVAFIPNGLFALRLAMHRGKSPESYPVVFLLGEFAKVGMTIALLAAVMKGYDDLRWLPLLVGLIASLKMPLFALWLTGERKPIDELIAGGVVVRPIDEAAE